MKKQFRTTTLFLTVAMVVLTLSGCIIPGPPPYYAYGTPSVSVSPVLYPGRGYGYWYGGNFWGYRRGYSFYNGRYYNGNRWHGGGYGGYR